ncbi:caspase family protein [Tardiphaga sp.]|uniref:caspase family protein n=1 Tax=Tardiphaga sp. TaxID=1926292 RepID=UPI0037DA3854
MYFKPILVVLAFIVFGVQPASAERRVALVIGNSNYKNVSRLLNPSNDASAVEAVLKNAKFDVVDARKDLSTAEMRRALREFGNKARDADIAVVYYAGHGIEVDGTNYLIPTDASLEQDVDVFDEAFPLDRVLVSVEPAKQLRLVILDACRDNPFAKTMKRTVGTRAVGRGLAKVEPSSPNTLIAFAAKAGSTASDGDSKNSPFAAALINHIAKPGLDLRKAFGYVRDDVMKSTGNKQEPYVYGSLGGNDVSLVPADAPTVLPSSSPAVDARRDYEIALSANSKDVWDAFIANYPAGFYTAVAKAQRNKLLAEESRIAAAERAKAAEEEKAKLAAEGARAAELANAAQKAKLAEEARSAAERKKAAEEAKLVEAERRKAAAVEKALEETRIVAEKKRLADEAKSADIERRRLLAAEEARRFADQKKVEDERRLTEVASTKKPESLSATSQSDNAAKQVGQVASLQPDAKVEPPSNVSDLSRQIKVELRRVGCFSGAIDGSWNTDSQKTLEKFSRYSGMKVDVKVVSIDALNTVKAKAGRVCPLACEHGYKASGDECKKITCRVGYAIADDNSCEKIAGDKQKAKLSPKTADQPATSPKRAAAAGSGRAQYLCNGTNPCVEVPANCRIVSTGAHAVHGQTAVCP